MLFGQLWRDNGQYPDLNSIRDEGERDAWANLLRYVQILRDCERFHCLPSQLENEDWHLLNILRSIDAAEDRYRAEDRRARAQRPRRR